MEWMNKTKLYALKLVFHQDLPKNYVFKADIWLFSLTFAIRKKGVLFLYISHMAQKVLKCLRRQQGVTKNKLYNAKG